VACNKALAKLVSGLHKPDDQTVMPPPEAAAFVAPLPARALPGGAAGWHCPCCCPGTAAAAGGPHARPMQRCCLPRARKAAGTSGSLPHPFSGLPPPPHAPGPCARRPAGVGFKLDSQLAAQGIKTAAELRRFSRQQLMALVGERAGALLHGLCRGRDSGAVRPAGPPRSITVEDSFKSCAGPAAARAVLQVRCCCAGPGCC
jgi:hypothetical protein